MLFLNIFFSNFGYILPISLIFLVTSTVGFLILKYVIKENDYTILIPAGILTGVFSFIIFLASFSYLFKGRIGISIIFLLFVLLGFFLWTKTKKLRVHFKIAWNKKIFLYGFIYIITTLFLILASSNNGYGGDVVAYWGFATSFANGNYPIHSLWQPDLLANHHQGAFLYEGAVQSLAQADMRLIHALFAVLVLAAGFFLIWGWIKKLTGLGLLSILPAFVLYFSFGAIFILLPVSISGYLDPEVSREAFRLPTLVDVKPRLGGAVDLDGLIYINHRAAALGGLMLLLILLVIEFRISKFWKPIFIAVLSTAVISTDEIVLPAIALSVFVWSVKTFFSKNEAHKIKLLRSLTISLLIFILMFFIVGNALRDSLFTPSPEALRFQLRLSTETIIGRMEGFKGVILTLQGSKWMLYFPDLRLIMLAALLVAVFMRNFWINLILATGLGIMIAYFTSEHTFYPGNEGRFLDFMYPIFGLIISFSIVKLASLRKKRIPEFVLLVFGLIFFIPPVIFAIISFSSKATTGTYSNMNGVRPDYPILEWVRKNIPEKRILFVEGFSRGGSYNLTLYSSLEYGLMVPIGPAFIRVHTQNWGPEALDAIYTLNPLPLKQLKVDYIYITYDQMKLFPQDRQNDLRNPEYFINTYYNEQGILFKIRDTYLTEGKNVDGSLYQLSSLIKGKQSNIFLDYPPHFDYYLWTTIMLALKDNDNLFTKQTRQGYDYIETKIKIKDISSQHKYDYLILSPQTDVMGICNCKAAEEIWRRFGAVAYKVI